MVGIALEQYNFAQLLPPDLGNFASGDLRERRLTQVSIKLLLIIPGTQRFGKVPFSLSLSTDRMGAGSGSEDLFPRNK